MPFGASYWWASFVVAGACQGAHSREMMGSEGSDEEGAAEDEEEFGPLWEEFMEYMNERNDGDLFPGETVEGVYEQWLVQKRLKEAQDKGRRAVESAKRHADRASRQLQKQVRPTSHEC